MNRRAMTKKLAAVLILAATMAACTPAPPERPPLQGASIGGPFELTGKDGKTVRYADFDGRYRMVYFGYTFCPDVCPVDVQVMMQAHARFAKAEPDLAQQIQPLFITIDPARDTPAIVGEFAAAFSPKLLGLTGSEAQISAAAKEFAVYYARGKETSGGYLMDHSRVAFLMGREGQPIAMLPTDKGPDAVVAELTKWVR